MTSKNILFTAPKTVELVEQPLAPLQEGEFRMRADKSLVSSGTECIVLNGEFAAGSHWEKWAKYPFRPGYCMVGTVDEIGADINGVRVGERVAARVFHAQLQNVSTGFWTRTVKVPENLSSEQAAWFGMACIAQNGIRRAPHSLGDSVVVVGAGLLGQLVTQYLRLFGAREIIVIDTSQPRLELAKNHGASHVLSDLGSARETVFDLTRGRGADVVYDVTGHPAVFAPALALARDFGTLLLLGDSPDPGKQCLTSDVMTRGVQIIAAHDGNPPQTATARDRWTHQEMADLFFHFLQSGQMRVGDMITHRYAPNEAPECYDMLLSDRSRALGVIFDWSQQ
ncbi:MAG TPA: zinc-binding alcohol dehydrogenase [Abditibacterium sp.]|jgi:2-desacetyl-2-hydroxyethyl bacteriochlorophyllide A dehydrogenase